MKECAILVAHKRKSGTFGGKVMSSQVLTKILFLIWLGIFAGSFIMYALTPSNDFGFTAGLNRVMVFLGWQLAAGFVGIIVWLMGRFFVPGSLWRWLCRAPAIFAVLLFLMIVFLIMGAKLGKSKPQQQIPPDRPVTEPVNPTLGSGPIIR